MARSSAPLRLALAAALLAAPAPASALSPGGAGTGAGALFAPVAVDCRAAAEREARRTGGRVLAVRPDGPASCEVTLLVPNKGGRPRRVVRSVPA